MNEIVMTEQLLRTALESGADLSGIACISDLKTSPSSVLYRQLGGWVGVGTRSENGRALPGRSEIAWHPDVKSLLVIAVHHPEQAPVLDWWQREGQPGGTKGNLELIRILNRVLKWVEQHAGIKTSQVPYGINEGGVFLKDAAVAAGLGVVGKNNLLVTPAFGPRVRLRALELPFDFESTGPIDFDPCTGCGEPCRTACPKNVFGQKIYHPENKALTNQMPGRDGAYNRNQCQMQMEKNLDDAESLSIETEDGTTETIRIHYCRRCEFACPVGRKKAGMPE